MTETIWEWITNQSAALFENWSWWDALDIALMSCAVYWVMILLRGTRAAQMILALLILMFVWLLSGQLELATLNFVLSYFATGLFIIVVVIFQADIRRALARVGRGFFSVSSQQSAQAVEQIVRACQALAERRVGALIVIERNASLEDYQEIGMRINADLSRELLISLFLPYSPLHDGAVVIREGRISSAGCILPIALTSNIKSTHGTRHRAALGIAEETDAIAVVVSEETGKISLVCGSEFDEELDGGELRQALLQLTGNVRELREAVESRKASEDGPSGLPAESSPQ
jgi:diadenylate cyclase